MPNANILVVKVSNGINMIHHIMATDADAYGVDQAAIQASGDALVTEHHNADTNQGSAICDHATFNTSVVDAGKGLDTDLDVMLKSAVTTETIIPPNGVDVADIPSSDYVVCYS